MVLGLGAQVFEDALLPVALHMIPVFDHSVANGVVYAIRFRVGDRFVANKEVQVLNTALGGEMTGLGGYWGPTRRRLCRSRGMFTRSNSSRKHAK
jgi:hypothetical protein